MIFAVILLTIFVKNKLKEYVMTNEVKAVTDDGFNKAVESGVTLVDFWAEWCMPCRMQTPIMDEIAGELDGKATIGSLNVDDNPNTASRFGITGIPTSILFKDGGEVRRFVGVQSKQVLLKVIEENL
jgi:thioredoxin 1